MRKGVLAWALLGAVAACAGGARAESPPGAEEVDVQALADRIVREAEELRAEVRRLQAQLDGNRLSFRELEDSIARLQRDLEGLQWALDESKGTGPLAADQRPADRLTRGVDAMRHLLAAIPEGKLLVQGIEVDPLNPVDPPPALEGHVVLSPGKDQVKIDRGDADGLRTGHHLEVYQALTGRYLGRIEIVATTPHGALAQILPEHCRAAIVAGARVSTVIE